MAVTIAYAMGCDMGAKSRRLVGIAEYLRRFVVRNFVAKYDEQIVRQGFGTPVAYVALLYATAFPRHLGHRADEFVWSRPPR